MQYSPLPDWETTLTTLVHALIPIELVGCLHGYVINQKQQANYYAILLS